MTGKASEITDLNLLYARIGYRTYLAWEKGEQSLAEFYAGYNTGELLRIKELRETSVVAAGDMAFLDRLWQDWCPGYDATEDLRNVKQCLRGEGNLTAAIGYYRAEEPGLRHFGTDGAYAAEEAALATAGPQPTLYLHGNRDGCIDVGLVEDAERHLATGSRMEVVEHAGHFLHVEKPAAVNDRILAWVSA